MTSLFVCNNQQRLLSPLLLRLKNSKSALAKQYPLFHVIPTFILIPQRSSFTQVVPKTPKS